MQRETQKEWWLQDITQNLKSAPSPSPWKTSSENLPSSTSTSSPSPWKTSSGNLPSSASISSPSPWKSFGMHHPFTSISSPSPQKSSSGILPSSTSISSPSLWKSSSGILPSTSTSPWQDIPQLQQPSNYEYNWDEIDVCLEEPFRKIEDIISNAINPSIVREKIANRFGLKMTETYNERRSNTSTPATSTPSTPIMECFVVISDDELPELTFTTTRTTAVNVLERELIDDGLVLPSQHLVNERFPSSLTRRPKHIVIKELISPYNRESFSQEKLTQIFLNGGIPKWVKEFILSELKPLFMRTRRLDDSKKNQVISEFLSLLFPQFARENRERLVALAADLCKTWNHWRNVLWKKLNLRHKKYVKYLNEANEPDGPNLYLKRHHITDIFNTWLKFVSNNLPKENEEVLKNLIIFGFHCITKHRPDDARNKFFSYTGNLYTVNCHFPSGYNVATSMDLSLYEIMLGSNYGNSSSDDLDEVKPKKRSKN